MRAALVERFGPQVIGTSGEVDRAAIAEIVFADPRRARLARGAAPPARRAGSTSPGASALAERRPAGVRHRGAAPVRDRRRDALRRGRRRSPRPPTCARPERTQARDDDRARAAARRRREGCAGRLRLRERRHARAARRVRRRGGATCSGHGEAARRAARPRVAAIAALGAVGVVRHASRPGTSGSGYPLRYRDDRAGHARATTTSIRRCSPR